MESLRLIFWHGGIFRKSPYLVYEGGKQMVYDDVDPDELCCPWLNELAKECGGYNTIENLYYLVPGMNLDEGLKRVYTDEEVRGMVSNGVSNGVVTLYVLHGAEVPHLSYSYEPRGVELSFIHEAKVGATNETIKKCTPSLCVGGRGVPLNNITDADVWEDSRPESPLRWGDLFGDQYYYEDDGDDSSYEPNEQDLNDWGCNDELAAGSNKGRSRSKKRRSGSAIEKEDANDSRVEKNNDTSEEDYLEEVIGSKSDTSDDEYQRARENINHWNTMTTQKRFEIQQLHTEATNCQDLILAEPNEDCLSEYEDSEAEVNTPGESEDDDILGKKKKHVVPQIHDATDFKKLVWTVGIRFSSRESFKDAVTKYAVTNGRPITYSVSNKGRNQRLAVRCKGQCKFRLYASWSSRKQYFVLRSVQRVHTHCFRNMESNPQLKSRWMAGQFLEVFKQRPHWPAKEIMVAVVKKFFVFIKRPVAYKIKFFAHQMLHGSMKDHYGKLGSYIAALKELNPNSDFELLTISGTNPEHLESLTMVPRNPSIFQRFYICYEAVKEGFLSGCRPFICLDGCFLKTFLGGMLLAAVGRDANDQMYPVAWAVVEGENNESWDWFLSQLKCSLRLGNGEGWTLMSDQQKGLVNAVAGLLPKAEHRNCARHLFANWHKTYKGDELKTLFWQACRAYCEADYNEAMAKMKEVSPAAADAFMALNRKAFCRAFIKTKSKSDVIVNNMAETFNGYIINARSKHILYMLEDIESLLMERLFQKKTKMEKYEVDVCPRIQAKLEKIKEAAANCYPSPASLCTFKVKHVLDTLVVDISKHTCTCRRWDLTGIPCCHAVSVMYFMHQPAEFLVHDYFKKEAYMKSYSKSIPPCPGERHWPLVSLPIDPPPIKIGPGRPRRNRRKDPHEDPKKPGKLTRHGVEMTCSICKKTGHNKRKCLEKDNPLSSPQETGKRGRGRPRKENAQPNVVLPQNLHHATTAQPARTGRGRGAGRPVRGEAFGANTRGRGKRVSRTIGRETVPRGFGVYVQPNGTSYINEPGQRRPVIVSQSQWSHPTLVTSSQPSIIPSSIANQKP